MTNSCPGEEHSPGHFVLQAVMNWLKLQHLVSSQHYSKMKLLLHFFACVSILGLVSCETTYRTTAHHSRQPQFIDDIYMDKHNKNCTTTECIDKTVKYPENKYAERRRTGNARGKGTAGNNVSAGNNRTATTAPKGEIMLGPDNSAYDDIKDKYANMMGVSRKEINNTSLYRFIDAWYGVDYRLGGGDMDGIDCSGFVKKLYMEVFGVDLLRTSYEMFANCAHLRKADEATQGDLVFFKTRGRRISHVGVYLMNDYFVHASTTQGIMISSLKEEYWHKHFAGVGRMGRN